jgi:hypothetical protein
MLVRISPLNNLPNGPGDVYLLNGTNGNLLYEFAEPISSGDGNGFGLSLALAGNALMISDPSTGFGGGPIGAAYIFDATVAVPEPTSHILFGFGLLGFLSAPRRRQNKSRGAR